MASYYVSCNVFMPDEGALGNLPKGVRRTDGEGMTGRQVFQTDADSADAAIAAVEVGLKSIGGNCSNCTAEEAPPGASSD
jgi:hypothetical protein